MSIRVAPSARPVITAAPGSGNIDPLSLCFKEDFVVLDTETTGVWHEIDAIVEIAGIRVSQGKPNDVYQSLVNPGFPIPPEASAVHNITDADVAQAPALIELRPELKYFMAGAIKVAHNAKFDAGFVDPSIGIEANPAEWICTYRLARHVMPDAPSFGNNVLRYWLKTNPDSEGLGAHRAIDDSYVSLENFRHMLKICQDRGMRTLAEVRDLANSPIQILTMPFGKHAGEPLTEVPGSWFDWALLNITDMDPDLKTSIRDEVQRRKTAAGGPLRRTNFR